MKTYKDLKDEWLGYGLGFEEGDLVKFLHSDFTAWNAPEYKIKSVKFYDPQRAENVKRLEVEGASLYLTPNSATRIFKLKR